MTRIARTTFLAVCLSATAPLALAQAPNMGVIQFPTSANAKAQPHFETGLKAMYNFEFDVALEAFRAAGKADPDFELAAWGEAMALNHPLWSEQDQPGAIKALARIAPTAAQRAAKTPEGKERGLMEAVDALYSGGDKTARDAAYEAAMRALSATYPDDNEIKVLHALSILGTTRPGEGGFRKQMQAGAIASEVLRANPQHPGAAHYVIHAFDDPEHAPLALWAAKTFAEIAPDAPHALHMPSHIYVQMGMWEGVVASNNKAFMAADALAKRLNIPRGKEDFHALSWELYGNLQLGNIDAARKNLATAYAVAKIDGSDKVLDGIASMEARFAMETELWAEAPSLADAKGEHQHETSGPHMMHAYDNNAQVKFAAGFAAAKLGRVAEAETAMATLTAGREKMTGPSGPNYRGKVLAVYVAELGAAIAVANKDTAGAEALLKEATALEAQLDPPSGPPEVMKPSFEIYGEFLLAQGRAKEAAQQFEKGLLRTPNRALAVRGLAKARAMQAQAETLKRG
ncbi:MAG: hypothetical protein SFV19_03230 [Rhodospirillaceae bacterium]|nr:hypothetical protein [Rhodospirillaceae bacterium]